MWRPKNSSPDGDYSIQPPGLWTLRRLLVGGMVAVFLLLLLAPAVIWLLVPKESLPFLGVLPGAVAEDGGNSITVSLIRGTVRHDAQLWERVLDQLTRDKAWPGQVRQLVIEEISAFDLLSMVQLDPGRQVSRELSYVVVADSGGWVRAFYPLEEARAETLARDVTGLIKEERNPFAGYEAYRLAGMLLACHPSIPAPPSDDAPPRVGR